MPTMKLVLANLVRITSGWIGLIGWIGWLGWIGCVGGSLVLQNNFQKMCEENKIHPSNSPTFPTTSKLECTSMCMQGGDDGDAVVGVGCAGVNYIRGGEGTTGALCQLITGVNGLDCTTAVEQEGGSTFAKLAWCVPGAGAVEGDKCKCNRGYYGDNCQNIIKDCYEYIERGWNHMFWDHKIMATIKPLGADRPYLVGCATQGTYTGATFVLVRNRELCQDHFDAFDFNLDWETYKYGIDDKTYCNFFAGLELMYHLTTTNKPANKVALLSVRLLTQKAIYTPFTLQGEADGYRIHLAYNASLSVLRDSLVNPNNPYHSIQDMQFSTYDRDNDMDATRNCAQDVGSGWWFNSCAAVNFFGSSVYFNRPDKIKYEGAGNNAIDDYIEITIAYIDP